MNVERSLHVLLQHDFKGAHFILCCRSGNQVENGINFGDSLVAFTQDRLGNWCEGLPHDIDLTHAPPQLTLHTHAQQNARFVQSESEPNKHVYGGRWQVADGLLRVTDAAILAPPGTVRLTLSGGTTDDGAPVKPYVLDLKLQPGQPTSIGSLQGWPIGRRDHHKPCCMYAQGNAQL